MRVQVVSLGCSLQAACGVVWSKKGGNRNEGLDAWTHGSGGGGPCGRKHQYSTYPPLLHASSSVNTSTSTRLYPKAQAHLIKLMYACHSFWRRSTWHQPNDLSNRLRIWNPFHSPKQSSSSPSIQRAGRDGTERRLAEQKPGRSSGRGPFPLSLRFLRWGKRKSENDAPRKKRASRWQCFPSASSGEGPRDFFPPSSPACRTRPERSLLLRLSILEQRRPVESAVESRAVVIPSASCRAERSRARDLVRKNRAGVSSNFVRQGSPSALTKRTAADRDELEEREREGERRKITHLRTSHTKRKATTYLSSRRNVSMKQKALPKNKTKKTPPKD